MSKKESNPHPPPNSKPPPPPPGMNNEEVAALKTTVTDEEIDKLLSKGWRIIHTAIELKNKKNERLKELVKQAYVEGWDDCDDDESTGEEAFEGSLVNRILKEE